MSTKTVKKTQVEAELEPVVAQAEEAVAKTEARAKKVTKTAAAQVEAIIEDSGNGARKLLKVRVPRPVRTAYLAGLGAVSMAQDETETLSNRLVEQGASAEKEGRRWIARLARQQRHKSEKAADAVEDRVEAYSDRLEETVEKVLTRLNIPTRDRIEQTVETALAKLNVPTKTDIDRLSVKIVELAEKVDELKVVSNGHKADA